MKNRSNKILKIYKKVNISQILTTNSRWDLKLLFITYKNLKLEYQLFDFKVS